ncbi:MAG: hypothetical protein LBI90_02185 [Treponema sp.]|nr:hypothetical protein [Treponema sp.]
MYSLGNTKRQAWEYYFSDCAGSFKPLAYDNYHYRSCKKEIRDDYFKEIRDILNGYSDRHDNYKELFLDCFNRIKGLLPIEGRGFRFEWLAFGKAKAIIRKWEEDPLDVLSYLACAKAIEEAANHEYKRRNRK